MKKKMLTAALCVTMSAMLCACNTTNPAGGKNEAAGVTMTATSTPAPTATPTALELAYRNLPVSDYDDYVATTVLPEGYIGFEVAAVTEADVDAYVQEVLDNNRVREVKDTPLELGDIAIIDYVGYLDGATFEGGSAQSTELELGSGSMFMYEGFEEGLVGAKKGDSVVLNLKVAEDYWEADLAGKDVTFEVTIHSSATQVLPEFTDEFVTTLTSGAYTTTADFRSYALGFLEEERRYNKIMDYLVENTVFNDMNEEYIQAAFELEKEYWALQYGCASVEELELYMGADTAAFLWQLVEEQVRSYEQERVILYCVAKAENLELTEDEFIRRATEYAESVEMTYAELLEIENEKTLRQSLLMEYAMEHLLKNVVIVEKEAE